MQSLDILLRGFGRRVDVPDLSFDDEDCCALSFDEVAVVLSCRREERKLCPYAEVGSLADPSPDLFRFEPVEPGGETPSSRSSA